jgi:GTP-binding protein
MLIGTRFGWPFASPRALADLMNAHYSPISHRLFSMNPVVAIIGRPNVGKSTLFNRITRSRNALVDNLPGVTRDRHYGPAVWNDIPFTLVDTGGFIPDEVDMMSPLIRSQVMLAIQDADVLVMILDGKGGISPFDADMIGILRSVEKPVLYAVNKIDGYDKEVNLYDFHSLGIESLFPISAEHNYGVPDFLDELVKYFPRSSEPDDMADDPDSRIIRIAVVGRPNVGKSSLINRILGEDRQIVSDIPGTTRDSIDTRFRRKDTDYLLIDTAGIRRKARVSEKLEKLSIIKSLQSLEQCNIALIVLDASEGILEQDIHIAGYAAERKCACIFLLNKWDRVDKKTTTIKTIVDQLHEKARFLQYAPALTISALTGQRISGIFPMIEDLYSQFTKRIGTGEINRMLEKATQNKEPSLYNGRRLKFFYMTQVTTRPPSFVIFVNSPEGVHFSYKRYLINRIRQEFGLTHTPIHLIFRERSGRKG